MDIIQMVLSLIGASKKTIFELHASSICMPCSQCSLQTITTTTHNTGPLKKLLHYAIFQKFFTFLLYINGLCFTIHVIKFLCQLVSINHINV